MTSSATSVNDALANYAAGKLTAQELVGVVATAYYQGEGRRERLRPVMDVIERAHPGVVELASTESRPGFAVRLAERPFPRRYDLELRSAVQSVIADSPTRTPTPDSRLPTPGFFSRIVRAIRKVFGRS